ncbi:protein windpipe [Anopheles darlingi]|uniref:protein windpipe n=1 Tax=Anopheles darlingi TaxID=43151 RepID=UPI0021000DF6|nr:protein windpipe [Anopheles darlingi]XP_049545708.1 protein windpipe [Anopheles darlingi]XP_049545709.1 protein windpipe [Anopheles darlingi]XP_049545710.1 protein windpipe [Anopheles darlingi]XP_049545711.1 protein windpipe [Anopheles darlingi]XP_049545712.1 protein windpipe [Anopheles darlingi]XP_049545713.1 protein windpipe [Anopheles darlingi]XP_049545714.1 protein windpipe [Anopheles darlingi]
MSTNRVWNRCWLLVLLLLAVTLTVSSVTASCPPGCHCSAVNATIRCTTVTGLRSLDKTQPIGRLDLSGLNLTKVPALLENVRNITELDLSGNQLAEVNHLSRRIRTLNLSHNRLSSAKLARIPVFVESLNLTHNAITYLPLSMMKLKRLRYIELASNPINCTCETLHVRNWLTSRHVWSDEHIKCSAPQEFKGRPWLQVRQSDVCHPSVVEERNRGAGHQQHEDEDGDGDENDLMLGDQAVLPMGDEAEEDDLGREFLPVGGERVKRRIEHPAADVAIDFEGSGDDTGGPAGPGEDAISKEVRANLIDEATVEGSGSEVEDGDQSSPSTPLTRLFDVTEDPPEDDDGGSGEGLPVDIPLSISGLGIFQHTTPEPEVATTVVAGEKPRRISHDGDVRPDEGGSKDEEKPLLPPSTVAEQNLADAQNEDNTNTYILLAVLGIIVVSLVITVICKRKPDSQRNRRGKYDVEEANKGREMKEINKNLLEKVPPGERNGRNGAPEATPLMSPVTPDYDKVFGGQDGQKKGFTPVKPQRASLERPLESFKPEQQQQQHQQPPIGENNNSTALPNGNGAVPNGTAAPVAGVHQPSANNHHPHHQQVPSADTPDDGGRLLAAEPAGPESPRSKRYSPIYVPTSPKSDRYSPVYSPETGRVKIKLTETPKPKTPILVTRSRSRAGDIIMTTNDDQKF